MEEHAGGQKGFRIGRLCTRREARGHGHTTRLLQAALADVGDYPCRIDSQTYLEDMYAQPRVRPRRRGVHRGRHPARPYGAAVHWRHGRRRPLTPVVSVQSRSSGTTCSGWPWCCARCGPEIGGVLIRGEKGTAKSTAVRGLATVLAEAGFGRLVELPIGATEDRVIGSLDLQRVLRDGEHAFTPGLLAAGARRRALRRRGEPAARPSGRRAARRRRDGPGAHRARRRVAQPRGPVHPGRHDEPGRGRTAAAAARPVRADRRRAGISRDVDERVDGDPAADGVRGRPRAFARRYADQDAALAQRIATARLAVGDVVLPDRELRRIASLCAAFGVDGMRADLVVARAAVAHAAWRGADVVDDEDIRVAAQLALPHRRRRDPFDEPGLDPQKLDDALAQTDTTTRSLSPIHPAAVCRMPKSHDDRAVTFAAATQRPAGRAVSHPTAHGAGCRRRCAGPPFAGPQPVRCCGVRASHRRVRGSSVRHGTSRGAPRPYARSASGGVRRPASRDPRRA